MNEQVNECTINLQCEWNSVYLYAATINGSIESSDQSSIREIESQVNKHNEAYVWFKNTKYSSLFTWKKTNKHDEIERR